MGDDRRADAWRTLATPVDLEKTAFIGGAMALGRAIIPRAAPLIQKALPYVAKAGVLGAGAARLLGKGAVGTAKVAPGQAVNAYKMAPETMDKIAPSFILRGRGDTKAAQSARQAFKTNNATRTRTAPVRRAVPDPASQYQEGPAMPKLFRMGMGA